MSPEPKRLDARHLGEPVARIEGRNSTKATILFHVLDGRQIAVKTYAERPFLVRHLLGRWLIRHEAEAYERFSGIAGIAPFVGRVGPFALATERIDGEPLSKVPSERLTAKVFDDLSSLLDTLHGRGLALGDLHHRDVLVTQEPAVWVIDLATAWWLGESPWPLRRKIFDRLCDVDRVSLARMRARFKGEDIDAAVQAVGERQARMHRRGRRLKAFVDRLRGRERS